jgi:CTP synthase
VRELQIALLGDYDPAVTAHQAIPQALALAGRDLSLSVIPHWIHTTELPTSKLLATAAGMWCVPASGYGKSVV